MQSRRNNQITRILFVSLFLLVATTSVSRTPGAASLQSSAPTSKCIPTSQIIQGDLNDDGQVNETDIQLLTDMLFELSPQDPDADLDADGSITVTDLQALINLSIIPPSQPPQGDLFVSTKGDDNNQGSEAEPLRTVQEAINRSKANDTIVIIPGTYDLNGFSRTIDYTISLVGHDRCSTILRNGGTLTFLDGFTVSNLTFKDYNVRVFGLNGGANDVIDGVTIENSRFENLTHVIRSYTDGILTNVLIDNNQFVNLITQTGKISVMRLDLGLISNVTISNNTFINLITHSDTMSTVAVKVGDNVNRDTTRNIFITNNYFDNLVGGTVSTDPNGNEFPGMHAIHAFGENINILYNTVREVTFGKDHEAIYMKAINSTIAHNVVHNGGSNGGGDGDITIKGGANVNNLVFGNRVTGDQAGTGIAIHGEVRIENNYVNKHASSGRHGINVYAYGMPVTVLNNHIETELGGSAIRIDGADGGEIRDNLIINRSSTNLTIRLRESTGIVQSGNVECKGRNCDSLTLPLPTCQNQGFVCCEACFSGAQSQFDTSCASGTRCCDPPF